MTFDICNFYSRILRHLKENMAKLNHPYGVKYNNRPCQKPSDTENEEEKDRCYRLFQKLSTLSKDSFGFVNIVVNTLDRFMRFLINSSHLNSFIKCVAVCRAERLWCGSVIIQSKIETLYVASM